MSVIVSRMDLRQQTLAVRDRAWVDPAPPLYFQTLTPQPASGRVDAAKNESENYMPHEAHPVRLTDL